MAEFLQARPARAGVVRRRRHPGRVHHPGANRAVAWSQLERPGERRRVPRPSQPRGCFVFGLDGHPHSIVGRDRSFRDRPRVHVVPPDEVVILLQPPQALHTGTPRVVENFSGVISPSYVPRLTQFCTCDSPYYTATATATATTAHQDGHVGRSLTFRAREGESSPELPVAQSRGQVA
jgi:hypothetical protein